MKAIYIPSDLEITPEFRNKFAGCRVENADAFQGVSSDITVAEVHGDYPDIVKALEDAGIEVIADKTKKAKPKK